MADFNTNPVTGQPYTPNPSDSTTMPISTSPGPLPVYGTTNDGSNPSAGLGSGGATVNDGTSTDTSGGGLGSALSSIFGNTNLTQLLGGGAQALQQWNNAGQIKSTAEQYAGTLNPYGPYRQAGADKLAALQADPSSVVNTPGYKFALSQGLGAVANRDNRSFGVGAGSTSPDMANYAEGLASKTYNDTIKQYSDQAGVGIGPQAAAGMLQTGLTGSIASQNAALAALFGGLGSGTNANNQPGAASNDPVGNALRLITGGNGGNGSTGAAAGSAAALQQLFPNMTPDQINQLMTSGAFPDATTTGSGGGPLGDVNAGDTTPGDQNIINQIFNSTPSNDVPDINTILQQLGIDPNALSGIDLSSLGF